MAMNMDTWAEGAPTLEAHAKINELFNKSTYSAADKAQMVALLKQLGLDKSDAGNKLARLRQNRGHLLSRTAGKVTITATGRDNWIGWVELKTEPVNENATKNTAMVLRDIDA